MSEKKTVLLVDDEADIRELYKLVLESAGFTVIAESNAADALKRLTAHAVDLVITDYQMPEMRGDQLIGVIREQYPGLPTILASGLTHVDVLAKTCRADGHYHKGTSTMQLVDMVQVALT
ncbi:MAG: C4-dicarboxylate transport transcriptional regulatory protein DctD [bacterium ADurb.Bin429]|nr:MAG: C4-dicarboxylate transport transcriptional regulatory protein DctD [bacterium ADurb.Bin429]